MSKYQPLSERLSGHSGNEWRASFAEIEEVLGFPLPKTAKSGRAWWSGDADKPHVKAWTGSGWQAEADPAAGAVTFRKSDISAAALEAAGALSPVGEIAGQTLQIPDPPPAPHVLVHAGPADAAPEASKRRQLPHLVGVGALVAGSVALLAGLGALAMRGLNSRK